MRGLIVIPTYNEAANVALHLERLIEVTRNEAAFSIDILIVDDNSPDGTGSAVTRFMALHGLENSLFLLTRAGKLGLASAYIAGIRWALDRGYDYCIIMDADMSHNPRYIPRIIEALKENALVVGSRYVPGGGVAGWGLVRKIISRGGSLYARLVLRCPLKDFTSGYTGWRRDALEKIDIDSILSQGYSFNIEIKFRAFKAGIKILEIPILFENRVSGKSKLPASSPSLTLRQPFGRSTPRIYREFEGFFTTGPVSVVPTNQNI